MKSSVYCYGNIQLKAHFDHFCFMCWCRSRNQCKPFCNWAKQSLCCVTITINIAVMVIYLWHFTEMVSWPLPVTVLFHCKQRNQYVICPVYIPLSRPEVISCSHNSISSHSHITLFAFISIHRYIKGIKGKNKVENKPIYLSHPEDTVHSLIY